MESQLTKEKESIIDTAVQSKRLTMKQGVFVKTYLETGNGTESARRAYNGKKNLTQRVIASENLTKPNVIQVLNGIGKQLESNLEDLAFNAKSENVKLGATITGLAYVYGKPTEHIDLHSDNKSLNIESVNIFLSRITERKGEDTSPPVDPPAN